MKVEMKEKRESVLTLVEEAFEKYSDRIALVYLGQQVTYAKLRELIDRFVTSLANLGIKHQDKVIIYIPNTPQWVISCLAVMKIGGVPVPISPIYTPLEVSYISNDCGAETVICQDTNFGYVREVTTKSPLKRIIYTNVADLLPRWKKWVGFIFDKVPRGRTERADGVYHFLDLLKSSPNPPQVEIRPREDLSLMLYTGGTTGIPKGVPFSHASFYYIILEMAEVIKGTHVEEGKSKMVFTLPLFHLVGEGVFLGYLLLYGNTTILMPRVEVDAVLDYIQHYKADLFVGVPALYRMILENDRLDQYDLSSLRYCWSGADVLPLEVFRRCQSRVNLPIHQLYGTTETGLVAFTPLNKEPMPKSVGIPARVNGVIHKKITLVDADTLEPVPQGTPGELLLSCPSYLLNTYWNKPEETAESFVELDGEIYYRTKDVVEMRNGEYYFVDRSADVIKYKGYRVSASEIETVLQDHPAVIGACVVGIKDPRVGERIKAFVVLKEDVRGVSVPDLLKWCRAKLSPYKIPHYIEFRDSLPKSKVGKLLRREMREEERRRQAKEAGKEGL